MDGWGGGGFLNRGKEVTKKKEKRGGGIFKKYWGG